MSRNRQGRNAAWGVLLALVSVTLFTHAERKPPPRTEGKEGQARQWGSFDTPFATDSPWNSRPVDPVFSDASVPAAKYAPAIESGKWSTGVFHALPGKGGPVTVHGPPDKPGLWRADDRTFENIVLPRWPEGVKPASGSDGHAEIVDTATGIVHSFWKLRIEQGKWIADQYAWTSLGGSGWGDPAHTIQGARAAGVSAIGGLIRTQEVNDAQALYRHALSMSLPTTALAPAPAYVYPATSADKEAKAVNTGRIPEGALLMLPAAFDTATIDDARIRKIAETLKVYGAYVVDRNGSTGFVIYSEIDSGLELHGRVWNAQAVADLEKIRVALRQVTGARQWVDGDGKVVKREPRANLLSMRGPWTATAGHAKASFDSWSQSLVLEGASGGAIVTKTFADDVTEVSWAKPAPGDRYRVECRATGGATCRLQMRKADAGDNVVDSGDLADKATAQFAWPAGKVSVSLTARASSPSATVRMLLTRQ